MFDATPQERAYIAPFFAFFLPALLGAIVGSLFDGQAFWVVAHTQYWVQPMQTVLCGGLLLHYRRYPHWQMPKGSGFAIAIGIAALILWVAPQEFLHREPRVDGFRPDFFGAQGWPFWLNLSMRFVRLVVVVPLLEELFWRGFLLRYIINNDFLSVPMGTFEWKSCGLVALLFMLEHQPSDYAAAFATGLLFNWVAYRTKSLSACVLTHAVTNLLLGFYILKTGQYGFW